MDTPAPNAAEEAHRFIDHDEQPTLVRSRKRVQLDYELDAFLELETLRKLGKHRNLASLFRDAIRIYRWLLTRTHEGYQIQLVKNGQTMTLDSLLNF